MLPCPVRFVSVCADNYNRFRRRFVGPADTAMKIVATADLHYNIARSKLPTEQLAAHLRSVKPDVLLLAGDLAGQRLAVLEDCLRLFEPLDCPRLFVPGNHELWTTPGQNSLRRYERTLPELCRRCGVHYLDAEPFFVDHVAFVGNIGWYDYSFRSPRLGIPDRFYQAKVAPGAAAVLDQHRHLLDGDGLDDQALKISTRWMDGVHIRMDLDDRQFTSRLLGRVVAHLEAASGRADRVIAALHHLPFRELVHYNSDPNWDFANAFMGSELFGQALLAEPKVTDVFCAHSHRPGRMTKGHLTCVSIGSTYTKKRYEVLEL